MSINFAFIKSLYRASPVAFGAMDAVSEEMIYSSGHAESLLGYSKEELKSLSKNLFESIVHPEDLDRSRTMLKELTENKNDDFVEGVLRIRKSDGEYLHLHIRDIIFERDNKGGPVKFATIVQDISKTVVLEQELDQKVNSLKMISYKNSHELRAPVSLIIGLVDLLKEDDFKTEYNEKIFRHLEDTVKKLDQIIHEINKTANS